MEIVVVKLVEQKAAAELLVVAKAGTVVGLELNRLTYYELRESRELERTGICEPSVVCVE